MEADSSKTAGEERAQFGADTIEAVIRERVRAIIEAVVEEELEAALGAKCSERVEDRRGYRHGTRERELATSLGRTMITMPRGRLHDGEGWTEWSSQTLPRYQRRTQRVDEAILGVYLSGGNTRRIKGALAPLLRGAPLGKDAVSRLVARLTDEFEAWQRRDLQELKVVYLFFDGWYPKVRIGKQRVRVPVLVTMAVTEKGDRVLLDLRMAGQETTAAWADVIENLVQRGVGLPHLAIIDGNPGLRAALEQQWPQLPIQRCILHKQSNLLAKAPTALQEELTYDYRKMIYAPTPAEVRQGYKAFVRKWRTRCAPVAASIEEAGEQLLTFLSFPPSQWKAIRTTNALERINGEFRRRTKTQASLPSANAVLLVLYGLLRSGQIRLRRMDGWYDLPKWRATMNEQQEAA